MFRKTLLLTVLLALFIVGCAPASTSTEMPAPVSTEAPATEAPASAAITLTDGLGRSVILNEAAKRVVSLAPSNIEILFAVGAGEQVVGRDQYSDYPEAAKDVTDIGSAFEALNTELIVSLKPDLIIAAEINTPEQVKALEDLGLTVYYLNNPTDIPGMFANLEIVGQLTGHSAEVTALVDSLRQRVTGVEAKVANVTVTP